jgi:hypothetical protein
VGVSTDIRPIVVCPLEFERRRLLRAGLAEVCDVQCCGPGETAVRRWCAHLREQAEVVVLAGLAGAVAGELRAGAARVIDDVVDASGARTWPTTFPTRRKRTAAAERISVTSATHVVTKPAEKRDLRHTSGADLVDLESETAGAGVSCAASATARPTSCPTTSGTG